MARTVISVEHLSKCYRLGVIGTGTAFRDLERWWAKKRGKPDPFLKIGGEDHGNREGDTVWALKDINFTVEQGDTLGIIGRNGAGKSTLLKVLSQITTPTEGIVKVKGRIASLLEVGTGFHGELTGRENIYLNGAINGMSRAEVKRKLDEIVDFSGVEKYIDTPVKRYSSGMYVRLAFAVAAHLDPDILIVDEVLAVGDAEFQKKCLGKMGDVAHKGITVLFVSHNMNSIIELCDRALLIRMGQIIMDTDTRTVVSSYLLTHNDAKPMINLDSYKHNGDHRFAKLTRFALMNKDHRLTTNFIMNEPLIARVEVEITNLMKNAEIGVKISSRYGTAIHYLTSTWEGLRGDLDVGKHVFEVHIPNLLLFPGKYQIGLWILREGEWSDDSVQEVTYFDVIKGNVSKFSTAVEKYAYSGCEVYTKCKWQKLKDWESEK